jgi:hypothetical protein
MAHIRSYSEVYALGHRALKELFADTVIVEEKIDGSQFSFGVINGELFCRSKGKPQDNENGIDDMFRPAVDFLKTMQHLLLPDVIYRSEYLRKPKHNTLCYSRVPQNNIIIYDIDIADECYVSPTEKRAEALRIGLECVPCFLIGSDFGIDNFQELLKNDSCLGGTKIEGVVIKNYHKFGQDKKCLMGKYVSEAFKEKHQKEWKAGNPTNNDVLVLLGQELKTDARWQKAVQHLTEAGKLTNEPKDIGLLMQEVPSDILKEEEEYIKQRLMNWAWPHLKRLTTAGLPEWYKLKLAENQFNS